MQAKIIIREHNGFKEWKNALNQCEERKIKIPIKQYFGQFQYLFSVKGKGVISLVQLFDIISEQWFWEIYCIEGMIFLGTERFGDIEIAQERIWELLDANQ